MRGALIGDARGVAVALAITAAIEFAAAGVGVVGHKVVGAGFGGRRWAMSNAAARPPRVPPPWFVHTAWRAHRVLYRLSGGRFLWTTSNKRGWGSLHLTTIGRRSGQERSVIVGYVEDGPNLVALAMNGWDEGHPAWWLNLEAHPDAVVRLAHQQPRRVRARPATGEERDRLWQRWVAVDPKLDAYAGRRPTETPVVVFEPANGTA